MEIHFHWIPKKLQIIQILQLSGRLQCFGAKVRILAIRRPGDAGRLQRIQELEHFWRTIFEQGNDLKKPILSGYGIEG